MVAEQNAYYICLNDEIEPIPWDPGENNERLNVHMDYFGRAFQVMDQHIKQKGWVIYLTWNLRKLPSYGEHVIVVLLGDEKASFPLYTNRVRMVFKCYGVGPQFGEWISMKMSHPRWLVLLRLLYSFIYGLPGLLYVQVEGLLRTMRGLMTVSVHPIPLGYANQADVPMVSHNQRAVDVFFAGSMVHKRYSTWSIQKWLGTPKSTSRKKMIKVIKELQHKYPEWDFDVKISSSFSAMRAADPLSYASHLMQSKIALVPRGASCETYRFFEAVRSGCVVIAEYLPPFWFYKDAPIFHLSDWKNLETLLSDLLNHPDKLERVHRKTLAWWKHVCSEAALGTFMAAKINETTS